MQEYVVGFMFDRDNHHVALVRKEKPTWQRGRYNGIGGKVEPGEFSINAMVREFCEETKFSTAPDDWRLFTTLGDDGSSWKLYCYVLHSDKPCGELKLPTQNDVGEFLMWFPTGCIPHKLDMIPNLKWLIPLALDKDHLHAMVYDMTSYEAHVKARSRD